MDIAQLVSPRQVPPARIAASLPRDPPAAVAPTADLPPLHAGPAPASGVQRVLCRLCGKSFSGVSSHNRHVSRTHLNARPFSCKLCSAAFGQKGSLERHIAGVHRKERPFACVHCAKTFGRLDNLRIHIATVHLNRRPFQCEQCPKRFGGRRPLRIHTQTVHLKQRPLACVLCSRRFGQRSNLNAHIRHVHKCDPPKAERRTPAMLTEAEMNGRMCSQSTAGGMDDRASAGRVEGLQGMPVLLPMPLVETTANGNECFFDADASAARANGFVVPGKSEAQCS